MTELINDRSQSGQFGTEHYGSWNFVHGDVIFSAMHMYRYPKVSIVKEIVLSQMVRLLHDRCRVGKTSIRPERRPGPTPSTKGSTRRA